MVRREMCQFIRNSIIWTTKGTCPKRVPDTSTRWRYVLVSNREFVLDVDQATYKFFGRCFI